MNHLIFLLFSAFCLLAAVMVVLSKNSVYSAFFLILCFFNVSCLLLLLELEYIAIVCLIIYVGAISILFLFVIMLLNLRVSALKSSNAQFIPLVLLFCILFACFFMLFCNLSFINILNPKAFFDFIGFWNEAGQPLWSIENTNDMKEIGSLLFNQYFLHFIVAGYILLVAMIGAIVLTLSRNFDVKSQVMASQTLRWS